MNRRGFLGLLGAAVLDPERLLWVPGRKMISIPAPADTFTLYVPGIDWTVHSTMSFEGWMGRIFDEMARTMNLTWSIDAERRVTFIHSINEPSPIPLLR